MTQLDKALEVKGLTKKYGDFYAVNNMSFHVEPGEIFGLLGPNGAGKTTIISNIVTLETPTEGDVLVFGHNVQEEPRKAKSLTGIVPQEIVNHGFFNLEEVLIFHSGYYGLSNNRDRIDFLIDRLGLKEHRHKKVKQLSGGMKRRLLIAKALVHSPKLLLLDEPTAGVDIELRESLWKFVQELRSDGVSVLLTTHYLEEAEELCDRVGIIHHGELRKIGPTNSLVKEFTQRNVSLKLKTAAKVESQFLIEQLQENLRFRIPSEMGLGELLHSAHLSLDDIDDMQIVEGNLEEAFLRVLGESKA